ncbi:uncharacterized protein Z518_11177 [Rhinocladiella mackenziei CBS 650.93]|uniref:Uncharacterized protein n=1 Tax=Rhinocladiella mackenziei CBS 650.93 TaxID=1442369 RepID=A0A0D2I154_9EURO|nr:uncharacterized protein Z518_11177 [Rhinocladiella mackenziei CBS 650.93]KIW99438.1 hypothetical protein Z518_11177 [Rhinocladiella mackenziei CBS 650.93]
MPERKRDMIARGQKHRVPLGTAILVGLRALDPLLQGHLLLNSPLPQLATIFGLPPPGPPPAGGLPLAGTSMTPYQSLILGFSLASAFKHILWAVYINNEPIYPGPAIGIGVFNAILNTFNTLAYNAGAENPTYFPSWSIYIGTALFIGGILIETMGELQTESLQGRPPQRRENLPGWTVFCGPPCVVSGLQSVAGGCSTGFRWAKVKREVPYALIPGIW